MEITEKEYIELKEKAEKWDTHISNSIKNLPNSRLTPEQRSELARKAVQARWAKKRVK